MNNWFKSLVKKKKSIKNPPYNIYHPDVAGNIEFAFECKGVKYYRAVKDYILPTGRYKWIDATLNEVDIRMTLPTLRAYIGKLKKNLDGSNGINLGEAWKVIYAMETRCDLGFTPETVKRLASVMYFDETEDLRDYDHEYGQKKVKFWEENGVYDFFLTTPIAELLNLKPGSEEYLRKYIQEADQILKDLILEPETPSSENT